MRRPNLGSDQTAGGPKWDLLFEARAGRQEPAERERAGNWIAATDRRQRFGPARCCGKQPDARKRGLIPDGIIVAVAPEQVRPEAVGAAPAEGRAGSPNCGHSVPEPIFPTRYGAPEPNANHERIVGMQRVAAAVQRRQADHSHTAPAPGLGKRRRTRPGPHSLRGQRAAVAISFFAPKPWNRMNRCSGAEREGNDNGQHGEKSEDHQQCGDHCWRDLP